MDAQFLPFISRMLMLLLVLFAATDAASGACYETDNFIVDASSAELARRFGDAAEQCRSDLAQLWLGKKLPDWSAKCPVKIHADENLGAGGVTSFVFENGEVFDWKMEIQGSPQRILDSVLPHEITHMVFASHFRKPLPRWLDEGAATSVEHRTEKERYRRKLRLFLREDVRKGIPLNQMILLKDYPADPIPLYAQSFSVVEYLLEKGEQLNTLPPHAEHCTEHQRLVRFAESVMQTAMKPGDWKAALQQHYGIDSLGDLQTSWLRWVGTDKPMYSTAAASAEPPEERDFVQKTAGLPVNIISAKPPVTYGKSVYDRTKSPQQIPSKLDFAKPIPLAFGNEPFIR
ncbi:MAG: hypothetical protein LBH00_12950 [Planctomycetaceae bacterium]|jgi:hypothetical protein|nr:hypothetical protein [Planctomycetaceae bacterium]